MMSSDTADDIVIVGNLVEDLVFRGLEWTEGWGERSQTLYVYVGDISSLLIFLSKLLLEG